MKVKHGIALVLAVAFAGLALTCWSSTTRGADGEKEAAAKTLPAIPPLLTTAVPTTRVFLLRLPWIGAVQSRASVELPALVAGRIESIEAVDHAPIEKGKLVARLGGPLVEGQRARLATEVTALESRLELSRRTVERLQQNLETQLATKNQVAQAEDLEISLQAQLREARLNLETFEQQASIVAPISGIFTNRQTVEGAEVAAGQVIGEIVDPGHLLIEASIFPPEEIELKGKEATIRLDDSRSLTGLVQSVLPRAGSTGAVQVWIEGPQIDRQLRPGQTVGGSLVVEAGPESLAVPESAIVYDPEEHPYLFVEKDGAYEPVSVRLGLMQDGWVEVRSGLEPNQSVVTRGAYELFYRRFNQEFKVQD